MHQGLAPPSVPMNEDGASLIDKTLAIQVHVLFQRGFILITVTLISNDLLVSNDMIC